MIEKKQKDISKLILEILKNSDFTSVKELSRKFEVSEMTIRRHLKKISDNNGICKVHGGVLTYQTNEEGLYNLRKNQNIEQKNYIAKQALTEIEDGQTIFVDSGTTCYEFSRMLKRKKKLNIITNDIYIAKVLHHTHNVYMIGGRICPVYATTMPNLQDNFINSINIDTIIMGAFAISEEGFLCSPSLERANIKKFFISRANKKILLVDSSKFLKNTFVNFASLLDFDKIFTDLNIDSDIYQKFSNEGVNIFK